MKLADVPDQLEIFIDANIYVYHFSADALYGAACSELIARIERHEVRGITASHIVSEVAHRLMTIEAISKFGWPIAGVAARLRRNYSDIKALTVFERAVAAILGSAAQVVSVDAQDVQRAAQLSQQCGLLSNDALVVAIMNAKGVVNLASNDADFDRVTGIARYGPH